MRNDVRIMRAALVLVLVFVREETGQKVDVSLDGNVKRVFPDVQFVRKKRGIDGIDDVTVKVVRVGDWSLELDSERNLLLSRGLQTDWLNSNDSPSRRPTKRCDYHAGVIKGLEKSSKVAVTLCGALVRGLIRVAGADYLVEPFDELTGEHVVYTSGTHVAIKRDANAPPIAPNPGWMYNLTGDTIDIEVNIESNGNLPEAEEMTLLDPDDGTGSGDSNSNTSGDITDDNGYFYDTAWTVKSVEVTNSPTTNPLPPRWIEIAVAVDYTLISFHGRARVEEYVLSLLNIVSAIYQDASLEANAKLVVTKLLMYENKRFCHKIIKSGDAKRSLENVNAWNKAMHGSLAPAEPRHDLAIWLTRSDIGGPSGYAPVGGVCDPKRSCALNRDEGLTSAFIIAHETAHILGLSHDGDGKNGNNCSDDALEGSVMAPMVSATFNRFYWSPCSRNEVRKLSNKWWCLLNPPTGPEEISLNSTLQASFTMDQQCRMEFGDGYTMCRSFEIIEPCSHLWCGHEKSPFVCKTKKGPPLEGTECGVGKWCMEGFCEDFADRVERVPILLNPQNGQWTDWSPWKPCSKSCGVGIQIRSRSCENPPPSFGGRPCEGRAEEWRPCKLNECSEKSVDTRAQQCKHLPRFVDLSPSAEAQVTWRPYESDENAKKCKLICLNGRRRELVFTDENLVDGTPCSYDHQDNICVQGVCQYVGCDGVLHSSTRRDRCGVCGGDNSECTEAKKKSRRKLKKASSRIAVLPEKSREIKVQLNATNYHADNPVLALILKNRKRKSYTVLIPASVARSEIVEGTKFYYKGTGNAYEFWTKGPLRDEMVLLIKVSKSELHLGINVSYSTEYSIHKDHLVPSKRFVWIPGGWGPCSASCGGGRRQKTAACFDNDAHRVVRRSECALSQKPKLETDACNTFSCDFEWFAGDWEPCSASCGTLGVQHREVYCLPNSVLVETNGTVDRPWRYMVNPSRCGEGKPMSLMACNRQPCFVYWTFGNWTQCSVTCGPGFQTRSSHCFPPEEETFFTCGEAPAPQRRSCSGAYNRFTSPLCKGRKRRTCRKDDSAHCPFGLLHKYCKIGGFRRACCRTCGEVLSQSI
ncbi:unnamed protein product [Phyllotreta striolata]|uniref:A disintegrin and metalloproteinase with thrombospondin motifs 3 n=1 Tax=Phyllotreta striolata TaxID=444603 RepID=A0A9N9TXC7_PHYSR|nr:unnamed protein product [Phyllotreta striolata]